MKKKMLTITGAMLVLMFPGRGFLADGSLVPADPSIPPYERNYSCKPGSHLVFDEEPHVIGPRFIRVRCEIDNDPIS